MKRTIATLLLLIFGAMLAACAWRAETDPAAPPEKSVVRLAAPYDNPQNTQVLQQLVDRYNAQQEQVEAQLLLYAYPDYGQTLQALATKGEQPELMLVDNAEIPALARQGTLAIIEVWLNTTGLMDQLDPDLLVSPDEGEALYACPFLCWTYTLYCNLHDITGEECRQLTDWQAFLQTGQKYSGTGKSIFAIAAADTEELTYQFQELLLAEQSNLHTLRVAEDCRALEGLAALVADGCLPQECLDWNQADLTRRFAQGALVTMLNRSTQAAYLRTLDPSFEWEMLPLPIGEGGGHVMGIQSIVVSAAAGQEAYDLLEWLMQPQQAETVATQLGSIAVRTDVQQQLADSTPAWQQELRYGGNFRSWSMMSRAIRTGVRDLLMEQKTAPAVLQDMQYTIDRYYIW